MREMKDSGVEWIGKIPNSWCVTKIKYLFFSGKGLSITKADLEDQGLPVISYGQIHSKENTNTDIKNCLIRFVDNKFETFKQCKVNKYDFIFADTSEDLDGCGNCCYKRDNSVLFAGYHSIVLHSFKKNDNRFLAYLFKTDSWRKQLRETASGVKVFSITQKNLINVSVLLPPNIQQTRIADFLDQKCSEIDALTADIQTQIETLEEYKKSVITEAVTKGLDPNVEMKDSGVEWIGKIPANWTVIKIKYLSNEVNQKKLMNTESMYSYLGLENLKSNSDEIIKTETDYDEGIQKFCHKGNILFSKLRPYLAKVMICPYDTFATSEFLELSPLEFVCDANYLKYSMLNSSFINKVNLSTYGAKMPRADASYIKNIKICITNLDEQHRIADFLDQKCSEIDQTISEKQQQLETLAEYKKSLIYEYVTGKKEVS